MKEVTNTQIDIWIKANNISLNKLVIFNDFANMLHLLIKNTYMGDDVTEKDQDKNNHFDWCWKKAVSNFEMQNLFFDIKGTHYEYFRQFYFDGFYYEKDKEYLLKLDNFFTSLFDLNGKKTKCELDLLGDLYKILEKSFHQ